MSETLTELCLHYIRGSDARSSEATAILDQIQWQPREQAALSMRVS